MPRLRLEWTAKEVDGIAKFHLGSVESETDETLQQSVGLHLTVQCTQCRETHSKQVFINPADEFPIPNSRGTANFVMKCSVCGQQSSIVCETDNLTRMVYQFPANNEDDDEDETSGAVRSAIVSEFQPLCIFYCRGLDIDQVHLTGTCVAIGKSGQKFQFDFVEEGELADYDERSEQPVSLGAFETRLVKL